MTKKLYLFMAVGVVLLCGCLPKRTVYPMNESPWVKLPGNQYIFEDGFIKITFVVEQQTFHYVFRNIGDRNVTINGSSLMLKQEANPKNYALWGELQRLEKPMADMELLAGQYMRLTYPVRIRSPFYPFRPPLKPAWYMQFKASWAFETRDYVLPFPPDIRFLEEAEAVAPKPGTTADRLQN